MILRVEDMICDRSERFCRNLCPPRLVETSELKNRRSWTAVGVVGPLRWIDGQPSPFVSMSNWWVVELSFNPSETYARGVKMGCSSKPLYLDFTGWTNFANIWETTTDREMWATLSNEKNEKKEGTHEEGRKLWKQNRNKGKEEGSSNNDKKETSTGIIAAIFTFIWIAYHWLMNFQCHNVTFRVPPTELRHPHDRSRGQEAIGILIQRAQWSENAWLRTHRKLFRVYIYIYKHTSKYTPWKINMTMEKQPFEDVSPSKKGAFPLSC